MLNTVDDAAAMVRAVNAPNYGLLYDTFHANIEEKDPVGVIAPNLPFINHVHFSENDRGTPGKGHVPWAATMRALKHGGYDGWCTIEAFGRALPALAAATRVWRDFFPNREEVYRSVMIFCASNGPRPERWIARGRNAEGEPSNEIDQGTGDFPRTVRR